MSTGFQRSIDMTNSDRAELRERLRELTAAAERLDGLLANCRKLPAIALAKATLDIDRAASRLEKHAATLGATSNTSA
jgi:hypothetical protein